ncbi:hypothetical protein GQ44DRAFT_604113 [Phaeosphaeriaceae sp. PMI808]|nr:hypothetical protein GQ44DRAFT_604113 [Phaeosphaeriaceae sp. PMI808]
MFVVKSFGLDDKAMVVTLAFFTAYLACQIGGAVHGSGQRRSELADASAQTALRYWFLCEVFYTLSTSLLKIAVGLFLLRITIVPIHIWIIRIIMVIAAFLGVAYTSVVIFQCNPVSYWWDLDPTHSGKCLSASLVMIFTFVVSGLNSFADWTFGLLPIFIVKDLQMKRRAKILVSSIIGLAAIGSTATIIRLPYTTSLGEYKGDFLYRTTDFAIWSTVEVGIGITAGCIATLRPLLKSALGGSTANSTGKWWSKKKNSYKDSHSMQPLDKLRPTNERAIRTTTVTGGRKSSESDKETFLNTKSSSEDHKGGINKSISTTVVAERAESRMAALAHPTIHRGRNGSNSTLEDEERGKPTKIYERF